IRDRTVTGVQTCALPISAFMARAANKVSTPTTNSIWSRPRWPALPPKQPMPRPLNREVLLLARGWPGGLEWTLNLQQLLLAGHFIQQRSDPKQHVPFLLSDPPCKRG